MPHCCRPESTGYEPFSTRTAQRGGSDNRSGDAIQSDREVKEKASLSVPGGLINREEKGRGSEKIFQSISPQINNILLNKKEVSFDAGQQK